MVSLFNAILSQTFISIFNNALHYFQDRVVTKFIFISSIILIVFGLSMFISDFLPIDMFNSGAGDEYFRAVQSTSFSWSQYRLHALIIGIVLFALSKFTNFFS
ncbi:MAG: hypothetical protein CL811_09565 [Colwelliaceae bacterium]|nr:hypothetical protein [Colwelliaceae bacterium]